MRHTCKECPASYRNPHDLEEHQRVGHVKSSSGPTWSDKDVEEEAEQEMDEQQCYYCKQFFPAPVNLHHSEEECQANQAQNGPQVSEVNS